MEFRKQPNNVNGTAIIASSDSLPDNLARIFHPNLKSMTAYRDAIVNAYKAYKAVATPTLSAGPKKIHPNSRRHRWQLWSPAAPYPSYTNLLGIRLLRYD
jgi:hypothetical protein